MKSATSSSIQDPIVSQTNEDWEVTKEIYTNSIVVEEGIGNPFTLDIEISTHNMIGIRRITKKRQRQSEEEYDDTMIIPTFEFAILSESPLVRLSFDYGTSNGTESTCSSVTDNIEEKKNCNGYDYENEGVALQSVTITINHIPAEFVFMHIFETSSAQSTIEQYYDSTEQKEKLQLLHDQWLQYLQSHANELLNESPMSFTVCNFIEHEALDFFHIIHRDDISGYSAALFHDRDEEEVSSAGEETLEPHIQYHLHRTSSAKNVQHHEVVVEKQKQKSLSWFQYNASFPTRQATKNNHETNASLSQHHEYAQRVIQNHWKEWVAFKCPICFDTEILCTDGTELPCHHFLCKICAEMYIQTKISELQQYRHSPFLCPVVSCKQGMKIKTGVYPMTNENRCKIDEWKFNLKYPPSQMLIQCPRKLCKADGMRRLTKSLTSIVFCKECQFVFCEICLKKFKDCNECDEQLYESHTCDERVILKLCRRYKAAVDDIKLKAEKKWHWLKDYASAREDDLTVKLWVADNASFCPTCKAAIERIEGCFHIHCTLCGTHFCYECGDEIFYPFYGTHHCWEENRDFDYN